MHEIHFDLIDSTNTYAKSHCASFPKGEITCITAEEQTSGYGRYQRKWISPRGVNICATFYFQLPVQTPHLMSLAQVMAHSFAAVLIQEGLHPKIKWPNDIQLSGKKLSGVLCETQFHKDVVDLFLGIGINVNLDAEMAEKIDQPATSLLIETGRKWDREALLKKLQKQWVLDLEKFTKEGFAPFRRSIENLLARKGQTIHVFDGKTVWTGICHSLTQEGQLNLLQEDGTLRIITTGDVRT